MKGNLEYRYKTEKPNILFIMADQFRADALGSIGGYCLTPNLDLIASRGTTFLNAYANSAECIPSRLSFATGLYPHEVGVDRNISCTLNPSVPNWMKSVQSSGYRTALIGKSHLHPHSGDLRQRDSLMKSYGFQYVREEAGPRALQHATTDLTEIWRSRNLLEAYREDFRDRFAHDPQTVRPSTLPLDLYYDTYIGNQATKYIEMLPRDEPWLCCVSFSGPHEPWDAPEPYASMYAPSSMPKARPRRQDTDSLAGLLRKAYDSSDYSPPDLTDHKIAAMRANYAGNVSLIDTLIGEILAEVERRGETEHTLVIFTSDHGEMNGDEGLVYKANSLDPAIKIPLIIAPPPYLNTKPNKSCSLVEMIDVGATIVDYASNRDGGIGHGKSLRSIVSDSVDYHRRCCLSEFGKHYCLITEALKLEFDERLNVTMAIDRKADPNESTDVRLLSGYQTEISVERQRLEKILRDTPPRGDVFY